MQALNVFLQPFMLSRPCEIVFAEQRGKDRSVKAANKTLDWHVKAMSCNQSSECRGSHMQRGPPLEEHTAPNIPSLWFMFMSSSRFSPFFPYTCLKVLPRLTHPAAFGGICAAVIFCKHCTFKTTLGIHTTAEHPRYSHYLSRQAVLVQCNSLTCTT